MVDEEKEQVFSEIAQTNLTNFFMLLMELDRKYGNKVKYQEKTENCQTGNNALL